MVYKTALEVFESPSLAMFWLGIDNMNNNFGQFRYVSDNKIATNNETPWYKNAPNGKSNESALVGIRHKWNDQNIYNKSWVICESSNPQYTIDILLPENTGLTCVFVPNVF